ncbi:hypothetical protein KR084_009584, partial [Drosophila pseudotakahashii]
KLNNFLYFSDDLSVYGITPQHDYEINALDDIENASASYIDASLDLTELIPGFQREPNSSELRILSNPIGEELHSTLDSITPNSAFPCLKRNLTICTADNRKNVNEKNLQLEYGKSRCHMHDRDTPSPTASFGSSSDSSTSGIQSDISEISQKRPLDPFTFDSVRAEKCSQPFECSQNNLKCNSKYLNKISRTYPYVTDSKLKNSQNSSELQILETSLKSPPKAEPSKSKTIYLSSHDYKALMQKIQLNGNNSSKLKSNVGSKIPNILIKKNNTKLLQPLEEKHNPRVDNLYDQIKEQQNTHLNVGPKCDFLNTLTMNDKIYKKRQRMIKNRESACLSRKKRKEYVVSLENRINKLEAEYSALKVENITIRDQLLRFANLQRHCNCEDGNANELLLNNLGPKPNNKIQERSTKKLTNSRNKLTTATVKKNVAVLFAMAFMVTLNAGNLHSYLNNSTMKNGSSELETDGTHSSLLGRRLLWVESEEEYKKQHISNTFHLDEADVPPLYFLSRNIGSHNEKSIKNNTKNVYETYLSNEPPPLTYSTIPKCNGSCNFYKSSNQSEYFRLAQNLHKLINGTLTFKKDGFKSSNEYFEEKRDKKGKRKFYLDLNNLASDIQDKQRSLDQNKKKMLYNKHDPISFINSIERRDDTFYVLSFNKDHALLPALNCSNGAPPKLSLVLPLGNTAFNGDIKLMQVDCEVFNTKEFELKSHMMPARLRPNVMKWKSNIQKLKKESIGTQITPIRGIDSTQHNTPRVRNFYMVGPKSQTAANASHEKTQFIQ